MGNAHFLSAIALTLEAMDVTLSELAIEMFFPADQATAEAVRRSAG